MDYEKRYKQLHTLISDLYPLMSEYCKEKVEGFFPELKESEDEKIRKELLEHCINRRDGKQICVDANDYRRWADWLEKQGKQKPIIEMKSAEESLGIDFDTYNGIVDECIYGEQKPIEWDEYDEVYVSALIAIVEKDGATGKNLRDGLTGKNLRNELIGWLRCLKGRFFKKISYETSGHK